MLRSKMKLLALSLAVAILGGILGKWAIDHRLPWHNARASNSRAAAAANTGTPQPNPETAKATEMQQRTKITFPEALRIAEATVDGQAYQMEQETEKGKPVIEVGIAGQEIFVDAETGKIVLIDDLRQKGDREDIAEITELLELQQLATVPIQAALQAAERFAGGQSHTVVLKNKEGNLVYEVMIELQKVYVDAGKGQVLYVETLGQADEQSAHPKSSIQVPATND